MALGTLAPLVGELEAMRARTLQCNAMVSDAGLAALPRIWHWSPIGWQFGHIACFEEAFVLVGQMGDAPISVAHTERFMPASTPPPERIHLPPRDEVLGYAADVRSRALDFLAAAVPSRELAFLVRMLVEHEAMHLEHLLHMLTWLPPSELRRVPGPMALIQAQSSGSSSSSTWLEIPGGRALMGHPDRDVPWDNEHPAFEVQVAPFGIAERQVTNREYLAFIDAGGYQERRWWSDAGWGFLELTGALAPYYWAEDRLRTLFGETSLPLSHPVVGVSWFEAEAFAAWAGARLPTETEWERAAQLHPTAEGNLDFDHDGTAPASSGFGGNIWEWTNSWFQPYEGFVAGPYRRYSEPQFGKVFRVLKGGCWATYGPLARPSFRNWYNPYLRQIFAGFRLAR